MGIVRKPGGNGYCTEGVSGVWFERLRLGHWAVRANAPATCEDKRGPRWIVEYFGRVESLTKFDLLCRHRAPSSILHPVSSFPLLLATSRLASVGDRGSGEAKESRTITTMRDPASEEKKGRMRARAVDGFSSRPRPWWRCCDWPARVVSVTLSRLLTRFLSGDEERRRQRVEKRSRPPSKTIQGRIMGGHIRLKRQPLDSVLR